MYCNTLFGFLAGLVFAGSLLVGAVVADGVRDIGGGEFMLPVVGEEPVPLLPASAPIGTDPRRGRGYPWEVEELRESSTIDLRFDIAGSGPIEIPVPLESVGGAPTLGDTPMVVVVRPSVRP